MALYTYVKKRKHTYKKKIVSFISVACIVSGISILSWVMYPILSFEIYYAPQLTTLIKPIPNEIIQNTGNNFSQVLGLENTDYTKASVWFPKALSLKLATSTTSYTLDIPKIGIQKANVIVGGEDLAKSLIHFTGALPGNPGSPVIFGHATLLWFYNPKDYKAIFSKLPDLKNNDDIFILSDNITFRYKVYEMKIIAADDLSVLEQNYNHSYITLVTCVPPGTYLKRLVVRAKLVNI